MPIKRLKKEALGKFYTIHEKILQARKAQNAHKQTKIKTKKVVCLASFCAKQATFFLLDVFMCI